MTNEQLTEKIIGVVFDASKKLTSNVLALALQEVSNVLANSKGQMEKIKSNQYKGKQSLKKIMSTDSKITNIKINSTEMKNFNKYAKKYSINYSILNDRNKKTNTIFFKAKDVDVFTEAFREFSNDILKPEKNKKPEIKKSILQKLNANKIKLKSIEKNKDKTIEKSMKINKSR